MQNSNDVIHEFEPLWGSWMVDEFIGQGNYGKVYKVIREEWGQKQVSAVKIISIPQNKSDIKEVQSIGVDELSIKGYFEDFAKNIINEIEMMYKLKGNSNIVSYEDHMICEKKGEVGWHILIRMEYLTSLPDYIIENQLTKEKIISMGIDICKALEACQYENIIHRDIKDANIFVAKNGNFKLGDFGIAKELSKSGRAASMRGTPLYMAPEVYKGQDYNSTVDTYSLGILMYKLLNKGRFPFMPPYPAQMTYNDTEKAIMDRMSGEPLTIPMEAGEALGHVILKACSFNSDERYKTPSHMREDLENVLNGLYEEDVKKVIGTGVATEEFRNEEKEVEDKNFSKTVSIFQQQADNQEKEPEEEVEDTVLSEFEGTVSIFDKKVEENLYVETAVEDIPSKIDDIKEDVTLEEPKGQPVEKKKNKWILPGAVLLVLVIFVSAFYLLSNGKKEGEVAGADKATLEEISINETIPQSGSIKLTVSAKYSDGTTKIVDEGLVWSTDNEDVARIDEDGNLTLNENRYGKVNVTATYMDKEAVVSTEVVKPIVLEETKIVEEKIEIETPKKESKPKETKKKTKPAEPVPIQ